MVSDEQWRDSTIHIYVSILPQTALPSRLAHTTEQRSMCYTIGFCWLPTLNRAECTWPSQSPELFHHWATSEACVFHNARVKKGKRTNVCRILFAERPCLVQISRFVNENTETQPTGSARKAWVVTSLEVPFSFDPSSQPLPRERVIGGEEVHEFVLVWRALMIAAKASDPLILG